MISNKYLAVLFVIPTFCFCLVTFADDPAKNNANDNAVEKLADIHLSDDEALELTKQLRDVEPTKEEAAVLARIANSDKYSGVRRRRAVLQLFDRHVNTAMTLGRVAELLSKPSWLKKEHVYRHSHVGIRDVVGESRFSIGVNFPEGDESYVLLRIDNRTISKESVYDTLKGDIVNSCVREIF